MEPILYTVTVSGPTDGLSAGQCLEHYYGDASPWCRSREQADATLARLETTGDWPDGRPTYRIVEGHVDVPWSA